MRLIKNTAFKKYTLHKSSLYKIRKPVKLITGFANKFLLQFDLLTRHSLWINFL